MLGSKRTTFKRHLIEAVIAALCLFIFCEYVVYYVVLAQCSWPDLDPRKADPKIIPPRERADERPVKAMFLADTHLLGVRKGHWWDKLRREWQMYRAFQTSMTLHKPDVVFVLGDVLDEGIKSSPAEFSSYVDRFYTLFAVPPNTFLYVVAGNHDMGFHYEITPFLNQRFMNAMKAPSVKRVTLRGNHFILVNSMALEGDGCFLCRPTEVALNKIAKHLKCAKGIGECPPAKAIKRYSRPILLQHYPMYRESDAFCSEPDEAPGAEKKKKFLERRECLSREASQQLLDILNPRLVVDGHTHHGCRSMHGDDTLEVTIPSFSWRNKNNPSFLLGVFTPDNYALSKCYMPEESTVIYIYLYGGIIITLYLLVKAKLRMNRHNFLKIH